MTDMATPWAIDAEATVARLESSIERGLEEDEALRRLAHHGPNELPRSEGRGAWRILRDQFTNLIVGLLAVAALAAFFFDESIEGAAIIGVILINAVIGFVTEQRAVRSMEALRALGHTNATVRRAGTARVMPADRLVPGDILLLDAGDILPADARIIECSRLQVDESPLTGESLPVEKAAAPVAVDATLAERPPMLYRGTAVTGGTAEAIVVATGASTELGRISALVEPVEEATPLEEQLDRLGRRLIGVTLVIAAVLAAVVLASGRGLFFAVEMAIALAVATIPEGLPIVATVALARGMWRMARRNALMDQLAAVETLGSTTVILTDKTGTLTENKMTAVELRVADRTVEIRGTGLDPKGEFTGDDGAIDPASSPALRAALEIGVLCNNATFTIASDGKLAVTGDPMEVALLVAGAKAGLDRPALLRDLPEEAELAFDPETKRMATFHREGGDLRVAVKGAPETIIGICRALHAPEGDRPLDEGGRRDWLARAEAMASSGQRVLGLASGRAGSPQAFVFEDLVLHGLVGFFDPPRERVRGAIDACQDAGIRVVMATGDHGATAWTVARAVGLVDAGPDEAPSFIDARSLAGPISEAAGPQRARLLATPVIARATPEQKLDLIGLYQDEGEVVAMTGDGVNDAPALRKADIGVAMGLRGTQVAREAADMVLQDDELGTIVAAVAEGRAIFANIRRFVIYLMSCNVSEIIAIGVATLARGPLPVLPLQILFLNLVTDVFPALALGFCEGNAAQMRLPPRDPDEPVLRADHWRKIFGFGAIIAASVLAALATARFGLDRPAAEATTIAFLTLALAQLWHAFAMRDQGSVWARNEITRNPWVWRAIALCIGLLVLAVTWSPLARILSLTDPGLSGWGLAILFSLLPLLAAQLTTLTAIAVRRRR